MELINQKKPDDCAVCCMTMLTGRDYEDVYKTIGDAYVKGKGMVNDEAAMERLGYKKRRIPSKRVEGAYKVEYVDFKVLFKPHEISPEYFRGMVWGRRALITAPSLNVEGGAHMIYWHYDKLFDPSNKKTYTKLEDVKPKELILFLEK